MAKRRYHRKNRKKGIVWWKLFLAVIAFGLVVDAALLFWQFGGSGLTGSDSPSPTSTPSSATTATPVSTATPTQAPTPLPSQVLLEMSFLVQAPGANWDPLHEDACEEASLIMVKHYLDKTKVTGDKEGDQQIIDLVHFGESKGQGPSITLNQLNDLAKEYYSMKGGVIKKNVTVQNIKEELAAGRPVILPAAGRLLGNPHFSNGGPVYHMLVVKGYDSQGFITNDPGIRQGESYRYSYETIQNAVHDWNPEDISSGEKSYMVFK
ncbi:MAG: hypothetical protein K0S20_343 [Patescibacteria group bacterium]|nr:hypothetical protein [Patescibacteria group bacterium]